MSGNKVEQIIFMVLVPSRWFLAAVLQYPAVQKAFFGGQLPTPFQKLADPQLRELKDLISPLAGENRKVIGS